MTQGEILRFREIARATTAEPEKLAYVIFFNVLLAQPQFDKTQIKESLADTSTLNRLGDSLCYLYHAMLKALQSANDEVTRDVFDLTAQLQILLHKGLHSHMDMLHGQAMKFAVEIEDFEGQMKLLRLRQSALLQTKAGAELGAALAALQADEKATWARLRNLRKWERLITQRFLAKAQPPPQRELTLQTIMQHSLVVNDGPCLSIKAQIARLTLREKLMGLDQLNVPDRIPVLLEIAQLIEANAALLEDTQVVERFLFATYNAGLLAVASNQVDSLTTAISMLERFGEARPETEVLVFERMELVRISFALDTLDIKAGEAIVKRMRKGIEEYGDRISRKHKFEMILKIAFFKLLTGNRSQVIKLLSTSLDLTPLEDPKPNLVLRIFFLMAHFELGNMDILGQQAIYAERYASTNNIPDPVTAAWFTFFAKYSRLNDAGKRQVLLNGFISEMATLLEMADNNYYRVFSLHLWLEARTTKKSWMELIKMETAN